MNKSLEENSCCGQDNSCNSQMKPLDLQPFPMAQPDNDRLFVMTGVGPEDEWQSTAALQFDVVAKLAVLNGRGRFLANDTAGTNGCFRP